MSKQEIFVSTESGTPNLELQFLRPHEVARKLRISVATVQRLLREGKLPGCRMGRSWLVSRAGLELYLERLLQRIAASDAGAPEAQSKIVSSNEKI